MRKLINENIVPYVEADAYNIDVAIKAIQTALEADVPWLSFEGVSKSFGRAKIMSRIGENQEQIVLPALKVADGFDDINAIGLDAFPAYSFMYLSGSDEIDDYVEGSNLIITRDINLVVWLDFDRLGSDNIESYKNDIIQSLQNAIAVEENGTIAMELTLNEIFDTPADIFSAFTISLEETQNLYDPRHGFRFVINAAIEADFDCAE